jgi:hypothetical protein
MGLRLECGKQRTSGRATISLFLSLLCLTNQAMSDISIILLLSSLTLLQLQAAAAEECLPWLAMKVWVPKQVGNPLLNIAVQPEPDNRSDWHNYESYNTTSTHRNAGTVLWQYGEETELPNKDFLLINTQMVVSAADPLGITTESRTTVSLKPE